MSLTNDTWNMIKFRFNTDFSRTFFYRVQKGFSVALRFAQWFFFFFLGGGGGEYEQKNRISGQKNGLLGIMGLNNCSVYACKHI